MALPTEVVFRYIPDTPEGYKNEAAGIAFFLEGVKCCFDADSLDGYTDEPFTGKFGDELKALGFAVISSDDNGLTLAYGPYEAVATKMRPEKYGWPLIPLNYAVLSAWCSSKLCSPAAKRAYLPRAFGDLPDSDLEFFPDGLTIRDSYSWSESDIENLSQWLYSIATWV